MSWRRVLDERAQRLVASALSNLAWVGALGSKASECVAVIPDTHEKESVVATGITHTISADDLSNEATSYAGAVFDGDVATLDGRLSVALCIHTLTGSENSQEGLHRGVLG